MRLRSRRSLHLSSSRLARTAATFDDRADGRRLMPDSLPWPPLVPFGDVLLDRPGKRRRNPTTQTTVRGLSPARARGWLPLRPLGPGTIDNFHIYTGDFARADSSWLLPRPHTGGRGRAPRRRAAMSRSATSPAWRAPTRKIHGLIRRSRVAVRHPFRDVLRHRLTEGRQDSTTRTPVRGTSPESARGPAATDCPCEASSRTARLGVRLRRCRRGGMLRPHPALGVDSFR
jgi:hypothetical protein